MGNETRSATQGTQDNHILIVVIVKGYHVTGTSKAHMSATVAIADNERVSSSQPTTSALGESLIAYNTAGALLGRGVRSTWFLRDKSFHHNRIRGTKPHTKWLLRIRNTWLLGRNESFNNDRIWNTHWFNSHWFFVHSKNSIDRGILDYIIRLNSGLEGTQSGGTKILSVKIIVAGALAVATIQRIGRTKTRISGPCIHPLDK
jgi:hypothetical protein